MNALPESRLVHRQVRIFGPVKIPEDRTTITAQVRYDDQCGNGRNSFAVTAEIRKRGRVESCGCLHEEVILHFPHLAPHIKWHCMFADGPMHYLANTKYWAQREELEFARKSAIWPDASLTQLRDEQQMKDRLPALMGEFKEMVESFGFVY